MSIRLPASTHMDGNPVNQYLAVPIGILVLGLRVRLECSLRSKHKMSAPRSTSKPDLRTRVFSLVLEGLKLFGIAIACLVILGLAVFVSVRTGIVIPARWFGLIVWTGFLAWIILRTYKSQLRDTRFWIAFLVLLVTHVVVFARILRRYPDWRMAWFPLVAMLEASCMAVVLDRTIHRKYRRKDSTRLSSTPD